MFCVMENNTDVIICGNKDVEHNMQVGFVLVGERKTEKGALSLAERRCLK